MTAQLDKAREARRRLQKVCDRLLRPDAKALDACASDLGRVIQCLERIQATLAGSAARGMGWQALAIEIAGLGRDVGRANALLAGAAGFHAGWARLLNASPEEGIPGYTAGGKSRPAVSIDRGRVAIDG